MCVSSFPYSSGNNASFQCFCPPSKSVTQNIVYSFLLASSSCQMPVLRWKLSSCKITSCFIPVLNYFVCGTFCIFTTCAKTRSKVKTLEFLNLSLFHLSLINVFNSAKLVIGRPDYLWVVDWGFFPLISNSSGGNSWSKGSSGPIQYYFNSSRGTICILFHFCLMS